MMERAMNFDIDCLRSFMVVADTMSVSRAAESVGRSQSTVSQQVAKLETQIGKGLLSRRKGRVIELTSEGGKLVQYARRILQLNDEAYASMSDDVLTGFVKLGVPLDFLGRDFTTWLARFKNKHPMVGLEVEANQSENLQKRSARGEFDLAFFKQETGAKLGTVALRERLVWGQRAEFRARRPGFRAAYSVSGRLRLSPRCDERTERSQAPMASQLRQSEFRMPEVGRGRRHGYHRAGTGAGDAAAACGSSGPAAAATADD
jgi:DNA-binding transcriptional LysR family regulator